MSGLKTGHNNNDDNEEILSSTFSSTQSNDYSSDNVPRTAKHELDSSIVTYYKPHSFEAEQFRLLKTAILFPDKGEPPRTIMVTSTAPGEGRSFVANNLAVTLANSIDEYVLLIDCDLRQPSIHPKFGFPDNTPGLSEYLTRKLPLSKVLLRNVIDKLTILPCGRPPDNPTELISSEQMRQLIAEVKTRYDDRYIILDSPPPYITAEANALAKQVDTIIIVVKTGKTRRDNLQTLVDTYGKDKILGIVKNFDQPSLFSKTKYNYGYNV
ncbi:MAG: polysaccharide biosynthesis tyrosine autokinase [Desulfamplus sp.]|nr:polysaccharide biosynthesis tyrosine autokinase [Desulfamplus sp.]